MNLLLSSLISLVVCTDAPAPTKSVSAPRAHAEIQLDGRLREPAWDDAPESSPFVQNHRGEAARFETHVRVLLAEDAVCVAVVCREPHPDKPVIRSRGDDESIWTDDSVEIFLDPGQTRSRYYQIIINAAGRGIGGFNGLYDPVDRSTFAVAVTDDAWTVEVRVPFETLRTVPHPGDQWGFNVFRTRHARGGDDVSEQQAWQPTGGGYREPHKFGALLFTGPIPFGVTSSEVQESTRRSLLDQIERDLTGNGRWSREDLSADVAAERSERLAGLTRRIERLGEPVLVASADAITDQPIFPWTVPAIETLDPVIEAAACADEFEPASFTLFATRDLAQVAVEADPLVNADGHALPASALDIHQVLCWYQSGWAHITQDGRTLIPELLIKNGNLIEVDPKARENHLKFEGLPRDSERLMPFDIRAFESKQIWLTFHPPTDAAPGVYTSTIRVREPGDADLARVPVRLTVHPFQLAPSRLSYSLYYRLRPSSTADPVATMQRMAEEVRNQVEHGINMPSTYVGGETLRPAGPQREALEELTRVYRELGLRDHPLILVTTAVGTQSTPEQIEHVRKMVQELVAWAQPRGYTDVYIHAKDEASPDVMRKERLAFQAVHDAGGKVFVACGADYFDAAGDLLDMPVISGQLRPDIAKKAHAHGHRVMSYGNPQAGVELPETYRRNYGIRLWAAGYDGGFDYQYQDEDTRPDRAYNDFAQPHYRNHTMAYPALGRPIDTRQWEGWREGVDDVRYLSTLLAAVDDAASQPDLANEVSETRRWLDSITGDEDLDALRAGMVRGILGLQRSAAAAEGSP